MAINQESQYSTGPRLTGLMLMSDRQAGSWSSMFLKNRSSVTLSMPSLWERV